jgi:hypothetical protein
MAWLFAIVVLILLVVSAGFRKFFGVFVLIALLGGGAYYLYQQREERLAESRIRPSEVLVTNSKINFQYESYHFRGRVTNNSPQYTLSQVEFSISVKECPEQPSRTACVVVADTRKTLYIRVPPGQARDFNEPLYFPGEPPVPAPNHQWRFDVVGARASPPDA